MVFVFYFYFLFLMWFWFWFDGPVGGARNMGGGSVFMLLWLFGDEREIVKKE